MRVKTPVLITGASGFVGANLLRKLIQEVPPKNVHVILRKSSNTWRINAVLKKVSVHIIDLRIQSETEKLVKKIKPRTIFHLAVYGAYSYQQDEQEIIDTNIVCTFNLIQACLTVGFDTFINTGTSSEYGININSMNEDDMLLPITSYGVSKAWSTLYSQYLALSKKAPIVTLRLFGVYGYFEPRGRLISNIILSLFDNKRPTLIADNFTRDFVFINDLLDAYLLAAEKHPAKLIFNIGSGKETSLKQVFEIIKDIIKVDIDPISKNVKGIVADINHRIADISLARKYLGWKPKTNLLSGLEQTVVWFKNNKQLYAKILDHDKKSFNR